MSSHYTYEIDERKLRVKLKDIELANSDEAWRNFESYSQQQSKPQQGSSFQNLELPLNRNVIVPVIFGAIILLFSFLLFNFISIKKSPDTGSQNQASAPVVIPPSIQQSTLPEPAPVNMPVESQNKALKVNQPGLKQEEPRGGETETDKQANSTATVAAAAKPAVNTQSVSNPAPTNTAVTATVQASPSPTAIAKTEPATKKKKAKRAEIVENDSTPEARPAVINDERDTGERPN